MLLKAMGWFKRRPMVKFFFRQRSIENRRNRDVQVGQLMGFVIVEAQYGPQAAHLKMID